MAGTGISSINSNFINGFTGLASGSASSFKAAANSTSSTTVSYSSSSSSSSASSNQFYKGLRYGAQVYATAVQALNASLTFTDVSLSSMKGLEKLTNKMITLVERALDGGTGEEGRKKLQLEFKKLGQDFRDITGDSTLGDFDAMSEEDIASVFQNVGLDKDSSESIAKIFKEFVSPSSDDSLASESSKAKRPLNIPIGAYKATASSTEYNLKKISNSDITAGQGGISTVNGVYNDTDTILNQNPGVSAEFAVSNTGSVTSQAAGTLTNGVTTLAVNETTGYSVVSSKDNLFGGYNAGGYEQLFLLNDSGQVVHQITNNSSSSLTYVAADLSEDSQTIVLTSEDSGVRSLETVSTAAIGSDPATSTSTVYNTGGTSDFAQVKISNEGSHIADRSSSGTVTLWDTSTRTADYGLAAETLNNIGFIGSDTIVGNSLSDIKEYQEGGSAVTLASGLSIADASHFSVLEEDNSFSGNGYYSYLTTDNLLHVVRYDGGASSTETLSYSLGTGASSSPLQVSMAYRSNGKVEVGLVGTLSERSGDPDTELYRLCWNPLSDASRRVSGNSQEVSKVLDASIVKRPDAYRTLADLKALKSQIHSNIKALEDAQKTVSDNIELVRQTGLAMLDVASEVQDDDTAGSVARKVQALVRKNAPAYLLQSDNLTNIAIAAISISNGDTGVYTDKTA